MYGLSLISHFVVTVRLAVVRLNLTITLSDNFQPFFVGGCGINNVYENSQLECEFADRASAASDGMGESDRP
jgi:hypothetical protein